jgi:hypothetical protein
MVKMKNKLQLRRPLALVGILVCRDLAFPEAFRALVRQGLKIVVPTFWMISDCSPEGLKYNPEGEALFYGQRWPPVLSRIPAPFCSSMWVQKPRIGTADQVR